MDFTKRGRKRATAYVQRKELLRRYAPNSAQAFTLGEGEHALQLQQRDLRPEMTLLNCSRQFHLELAFGNYCLDFSSNGSNLLLGSSEGHIALLEWRNRRLKAEFHAKECVGAIKFLHDGAFATAQTKAVHIYDEQGAEMHRLEALPQPRTLEYLPYHFLLASLSLWGQLAYLDVSTGKIIAQLRSGQRDAFMKHDSTTGVIALGGSKGVVSFFSPAAGSPLLRILAHATPICDLAFFPDGKHLVTLGADRQVKLFDLRNTHQEVYSCSVGPAAHIDVSASGMLGVGGPGLISFWNEFSIKATARPTFRHLFTETVPANAMRFVPFEDFMGVTWPGSFESIAIPGAGMAQIDTFEENIAGVTRQMREGAVRRLLEKLSYETIMLDPNVIGTANPQMAAPVPPPISNRDKIRLINIDRKRAARAEKEKMRAELAALNSMRGEIQGEVVKGINSSKYLQ